MFLEKIVRQMEEAEQAEAREKWKGIGMLEAKRSGVIANLEARFTTVPTEIAVAVNGLENEARLDLLHRLAATCSDLAAFETELTNTP